MKYNVYGVGNALLDYQVEVPFEFLKTHGFTEGAMVLIEEAQQKKLLDEIHKNFADNLILKTSGGCAANTLAGIGNFGGSAYFVGKIGQDENGAFYKKDLTKWNIDFEPSPASDKPTGTCLAMITPDAERTMLTHLGVSVDLDESDIDPEKIKESEIVYIEGYLWDSPSARAACRKAIQIAKENKKKVAFTFSDAFCVERHHKDFVDLAKNDVDILFCNETEALKATQSIDIMASFKEMRNWVEYLNITTGPRGALISNKREGISEEIPTWSIKLIDKLGAGDLFAAGFLHGITHGKTTRESAFLGCYSATMVIQQMSGRLDQDLSNSIKKAVKGPQTDANNDGSIRAIAV